ncbi:Probable prolyl 4-hydroxylase [Seminavis robusta]|uniref:Probable prolyl 4-hydroxylase n=1 Tax=Seminavis robusta TaxID=568900 RepID=A0A9N8ECP7_9STRA|nr:Probable prolyl 4-hydroxylase [Seminavis robusta]|eukprot:Sro806_g205180.1 Probable prolyl 4-hydroxylase (525) ;mRNA; f:38790-40364
MSGSRLGKQYKEVWLFLLLLLARSGCSFVWQSPFAKVARLGKARWYPQATRDDYVGTTSAAGTGSIDSEEALLKGFITNLFSVCAHIQNPDLYEPTWADNASFEEETNKLLTSTRVAKGQIVSLVPLNALGLALPKKQGNRKKRRKTKKAEPTTKKDFVVFDQDRDGAYFQGQLSQSLKNSEPLRNDYKIRMPLSIAIHGKPHDCNIFVDINPNHPPISGWMGHMATRAQEEETPNCVIVQLLGPGPLCALVATTDMEEGTELVVASLQEPFDNPQFRAMVAANYRVELQELGSYLEMVYQPPIEPRLPERVILKQDRMGIAASSLFHTVNQDYPGLDYLYRDPDILVIDNFLTEEECDAIIPHAAKHLYPCVIKSPETGKVYQDPTRTSTNANMPQRDVPEIVEKIVNLVQCPDASYLEPLQVLKYTKGQTFVPHTDGFEGPTTAGGFYDSGRLVTVFCYLNDVPSGGETRFNQLRDENNKPLSIAPKKGMAVLHFPTTTELQEDPRTEHEGCPAGDFEKWCW